MEYSGLSVVCAAPRDLPGSRRLLHVVGVRRTEATLREGLRTREAQHAGFLADIKVVAAMCHNAINVLDPFHIAKHLNEALDQVRRGEQVRRLRAHQELLLNYFRAKRKYHSGVVEGLNNKARVSLAHRFGHRSSEMLKLVLDHTLGKLPEPHRSHKFCC